jgi:predicted lipoprotein with Yx(FWY)xxD motif
MARTTGAHRTAARRTAGRLLAAVLAGSLLAAACGDDDDSTATADDAPSAADTTGVDPYGGSSRAGGDGEESEDGATTEGSATVAVASDDSLGDHLVGPDGRTLYLFARDDGTTTACTGGCAETWPPLVAASPSAGEGVDAGELSTADGIEPDQVVYHGHLLYYFAGDEAPGDVNGTAIPDWFAVDPSGEAIDAG